MVSNYALLAAAIGVVQFARALGSPWKEVVLVGVCVGVLLGSAVAQQASKEPEPGPPPPDGWRWHRPRSSNGDNKSGETPPEVLVYPAAPEDNGGDRTKPALGVAIVPGNPGVPHFYCRFGERLHCDLSAAMPVTVYVVGWPNFCTQGVPETVGAHVEDEAARISETLEELGREHRERGLVLIGHSIGAWVVTQHLGRQAGGGAVDPIARSGFGTRPPVPLAVLAMPYLEYHSSWKQRLVSFVSVLPGFAALVRFLSLAALALPAATHGFVGWLAVSGNAAHTETLKATLLRQAHHIAGMLLMVRSEVQRLRPSVTPGAGLVELRPWLGAAGRPPLLALFTPGDIWSPLCHLTRLREMLGEQDEVLDLSAPSVGCLVAGRPPPHGFVLEDDFAALVAALVASRMAAAQAAKPAPRAPRSANGVSQPSD